MTRNEAKGNLIHAIRWNDIPKKEALEMAIKALEPMFIVKSDGTIEQIKNCDECLFKKEWEKIDKLLSVLEKQTEQEPKTGHWIESDSDDPCWYMCTECHRRVDNKENYCPSCGAKMNEPQEGANE